MDSVSKLLAYELIWHGAGDAPEGRISRTRDGPLADEADQGSPGGVEESDGGTHCDGCVVI